MLSWMVGIEYDQTSNFSDVAVPLVPAPSAAVAAVTTVRSTARSPIEPRRVNPCIVDTSSVVVS